MDEVMLSEELPNLNESTDGVPTISNSLDDYIIKKEVEEIQFDLHHSIDIKEETSDVQLQPHIECEAAQVYWTRNLIKTLIEQYEMQPCLYNTKHKFYTNKHARYRAMLKITEELKRIDGRVELASIKKKIINLRTQFSHENNKVQLSQKSAVETEDIYEPSIWWYEKLLFLVPHVKKRNTKRFLDLLKPVAVARTNKASRRKRATLEQMSSLLDFIQKNKNVRLGTGSADALRADWNALARQVNAIEGAIKTANNWKKAYIEWKSHVRMKLRKGEPLSTLNKRCAELAELNAVDLGKPTVKKLERRIKNKIVKSFPKKATSKQMSSLLEFIQQNEYLRSGLGTADAQKAGWDALSRQVNAAGAATKTAEGWRKAYIKWKSHIRIKLRKGEPLSQQDKACVHLAGPSITDRCKSMAKELGVLDKHENRNTFRARKATPDQMSSLLDFIQQNENFRVGKRNAGGSQADWEALTRQLNAVRGTTKTVKGWKKTHTEWRSHVRTKLKQGKALSKLDKRCAQVMGLNSVDTVKSTGRDLSIQQRQENKEKIEKTSRAKKASSDQFSSLLDFIQENENIRSGKGNADDLTASWETLTLQLNSLEGSTKTAEGWRKTYTEWKSHVRMKFKKGESLSEQDKRCAHLMGLDTANPNKSTRSVLGSPEKQENQEKIEKTSGAKRATSEQLSSFLDFLQENENFRVGKGNADDLTAGWESLTLQLNALDGSIKTAEGWKKSYTEWKSHIRIKLRKGETLSELDERCMHLAGLDKADHGKSTVKDLGLDDQKKKIQKTPRAKRATSKQMWSLLDFIQQNDKFRLGKGTANDLKASWEALTQQLNALGGTVKTVEGWKKAYTEWKSHVRMKLRKGETLSVQDKRCAYLEGLKLPTEEDTVDYENLIEKGLEFSYKQKSKSQIQRVFRPKKATSAQMISLLDFIQDNENFCFGKGTVDDLNANWKALTLQLNTLGGSTKTVEQWKKTYTEWRSNVRSRLRRRESLSKLDRRYVHLARFNTVALGKSTVRVQDISDERQNTEKIVKKSRSKRSTTEHLSTILDFIQQNDKFRSGEGTADDIKAFWEALTLQLNSLGGPIKTVDGWKKAYSEWKSHVRMKLRKGEILSEQDKRCVHLAGLNRIDRGKLRMKSLGFSEQQTNREKASRKKRATADQMSSLLDFIEENENIRLGKGNVDDLKAGWQTLTRQLNSVGGASKTVEGWKKTHTEWKSHVRRKVRRGEPLSKLDRRCAHLTGLKAVAFGKSTVQESGNPNQWGNREKIVIKSRAKRATSEHMTTILDFIQQNDNFRLCKGTAEDLKAGWKTLSLQLNSLGGTIKTAEGWKKAYIEWKSHVRMKLRRGMTLSSMDKRCAHLAGLNIVTINEATGKEFSFSDEQEKIARTPCGKRATSEQMSSLLDFIQQNDNFRLSNGSVDDLNSGWECLTRQLNGVRGTTKTVEGWKKAYTEWKSHVRMKLRKGEKLSNQDKRLAHLAELNRIDLDKSIVKELEFLTKLSNGEIVEKTSRAKKATSDQMSSLLDYFEQNEYFRLGNGTQDDLRAGWEALTEELNAVGGATKTVEGWKKTYTEWKSHVRMKLRNGEILSEQDRRCAHLTGLDTVARNISTAKELDFSYEQRNRGLDEGNPGNSEGDEGKNETIGIKYFKELIDLKNVEIVQELNENTSEPSPSFVQVFLPNVIKKRRPS